MKILIAEQNPIFRHGLTTLLEKEYPTFIIVVCTEKEQILQESRHCALLILNQDQFLISPEELRGIEKNTLLVTSNHLKTNSCCEQIRPDCECAKLLSVVKKLLPVTSHKLSLLSQREIEILRNVALGKTNKIIAEELCLSPHTVHTHRKNILKKLKMRSASELTIYAFKEGILERKS